MLNLNLINLNFFLINQTTQNFYKLQNIKSFTFRVLYNFKKKELHVKKINLSFCIESLYFWMSRRLSVFGRSITLGEDQFSRERYQVPGLNPLRRSPNAQLQIKTVYKYRVIFLGLPKYIYIENYLKLNLQVLVNFTLGILIPYYQRSKFLHQ